MFLDSTQVAIWQSRRHSGVHVTEVQKVPLSKLLILGGNLCFFTAKMADLRGFKVFDLFGWNV